MVYTLTCEVGTKITPFWVVEWYVFGKEILVSTQLSITYAKFLSCR